VFTLLPLITGENRAHHGKIRRRPSPNKESFCRFLAANAFPLQTLAPLMPVLKPALSAKSLEIRG
jgi:hypothetical protein